MSGAPDPQKLYQQVARSIAASIAEGRYALSRVSATLGEVIAGIAQIERAKLTIFDSTGLAIQDAALAARIVERARERHVGVELDLVGVG